MTNGEIVRGLSIIQLELAAALETIKRICDITDDKDCKDCPTFGHGMRAYVDGFPDSWKPRRDMLMRLIVGEVVIVDE
jgi:hypothetical protein